MHLTASLTIPSEKHSACGFFFNVTVLKIQTSQLNLNQNWTSTLSEAFELEILCSPRTSRTWPHVPGFMRRNARKWGGAGGCWEPRSQAGTRAWPWGGGGGLWGGGCKHSSCPVVPGSPSRAARESTAQHPLPQESGCQGTGTQGAPARSVTSVPMWGGISEGSSRARVTFPPAGSWWGMYSWHRRAAARTSLVVQWARICPPVQGEQAQSPVEEDPTFRRATRPMRHNYRAWALQLGATATEPACCNYGNLCTLAPVLCNKRSHCNEQLFTARKSSPCSSQLEEAQAEHRRPSTAISKCTK